MKTSLLPSSATSQERAIEDVTSTQIEKLPAEDVAKVWNPDTCPTHMLPWLAWALSVDHWDSSWSETSKRQTIKDSIFVHQKKGTRSAIDKALGALALRVDIKEWFETNGEPFTFELTALANQVFDPSNDVLLDENFFNLVRRTIDEVKPVRSHYQLKVGAKMDMGIGVAGNVGGSSVTRQRAEVEPQQMRRQATLGLGSNSKAYSFIKIRMETE